MSVGFERRTMIYPTRRGVALMAGGAPLALALGTLAPAFWLTGIAWVVVIAALLALDMVLGAKSGDVSLDLSAPPLLSINGVGEARLSASFADQRPARVELALEVDAKLAISPARRRAELVGQAARSAFALIPIRRGQAPFSQAWTRWTGPMGLIWKQLAVETERETLITPDIEGIKQEAVRLFSRDALQGLKTQLDVGQGAEFHALKEFQPGMDTRAIDWKQSARHGQLLVKEFRTERNNPIVLAIDSGRAMCEPVDGLARIDWALNAALLLAYVGLKLGDRAGLYSFDTRPHALSGPVSGIRAFNALQKSASQIDYVSEETNYTLGLSALSDRLDRRSLVVVFTEFTDPTQAELMIETLGRFIGRHLLLFVAFRDEELDALIRAEPATPDDVSRAVIAQSLTRERELVTTRLRRMGVDIVEASPRQVGPALLDRYLDIMRRNRL